MLGRTPPAARPDPYSRRAQRPDARQPGPGPRRPESRRPSARVRRRRRLATVLALVVAVLAIVAVTLAGTGSGSGAPDAGTTPSRAKIVAVAEGQLGYRTDPAGSYCNKFSAYWEAGSGTCGPGLRSEQWCADFAAWVWQEAGAEVTYRLAPGYLNAASASFYVWATEHGTWHPAGSGYTPQPGDVAVYGLDPTTGTAVHVAVVTGYRAGARGPEVVNGDGDRTGFSVVETGTDQYRADAEDGRSVLSGYAAPLFPPAAG